MESLNDHGSLTKTEITNLLSDLLSDQLDSNQKHNKINNILRKMRESGLIVNKTIKGNKSIWTLVKRSR